MDSKDAKLLSEKMLYNGKWRKLVAIFIQKKLFGKEEYSSPIEIELTACNEAVICIPYIAETDEIILNQQFRAGVFYRNKHNPYIYELCAGMIEHDYDDLATAKKELMEETGSEVIDIEKFSTAYASPGYCNELFYFFCANVRKHSEGIFGAAGEIEDIKTVILPASEVIKMVDTGEIISAPTVLAINWFARNHERLRNKWGNK